MHSVTDRRTDQPTDKVTYRVACTRLKILPVKCVLQRQENVFAEYIDWADTNSNYAYTLPYRLVKYRADRYRTYCSYPH